MGVIPSNWVQNMSKLVQTEDNLKRWHDWWRPHNCCVLYRNANSARLTQLHCIKQIKQIFLQKEALTFNHKNLYFMRCTRFCQSRFSSNEREQARNLEDALVLWLWRPMWLWRNCGWLTDWPTWVVSRDASASKKYQISAQHKVYWLMYFFLFLLQN